MNREMLARLAKLMMCSATERYAKLYLWEFPKYLILQLNLDSAPITCATMIMDKLQTYEPKAVAAWEDFFLRESLPPGIPE